MAITLTSAARVRQRLQLESWESSDTAIIQFIADAEAQVTNYIGSLPTAGDANFALAGSIATDLAAYYTGISLPALQDADAEKARLSHIRNFKESADKALQKATVTGKTWVRKVNA